MNKKPAAKPVLKPEPLPEAKPGEPEIVDGVQKGKGAVVMKNGVKAKGLVTFDIRGQFFQVEKKDGMVDNYPAILVQGVEWAKR